MLLFIHECSLSSPLDAHMKSSYGPYEFYIFVEGQIEPNNIWFPKKAIVIEI
jgi:hypothetical protein